MTKWDSHEPQLWLVSGLEPDPLSDADVGGRSGKSCPAAHLGTHPPRDSVLRSPPVPGGGSQRAAPLTAPPRTPAQTTCSELLFCPAQHTCSTCLKTRRTFPRSTPQSSSSLQPRLSNSSISTGYMDTSSSPCGNLCGRQPASYWASDLFPGPESEPKPYVSRVH